VLISEIIIFICYKLYARLDKIINLWKTVQGTQGFQPWAHRTAADCSRALSPSAPPENWTLMARMGSCMISLHQRCWFLKNLICQKLYARLDKIINLWKTV
jgi:hypothetical protein